LKKITGRTIRSFEINVGFLFNIILCDITSLCNTRKFRYASGEVNDVHFEQSNVNKLRQCAEHNASCNTELNSVEEQYYATGEYTPPHLSVGEQGSLPSWSVHFSGNEIFGLVPIKLI
jgi:hypothetical protein